MSGFRQRPVEQLACRSDKGAALQIFLVSRLFADKGQGGRHWPFAKHGLGRALDEGRGSRDQAVERRQRGGRSVHGSWSGVSGPDGSAFRFAA